MAIKRKQSYVQYIGTAAEMAALTGMNTGDKFSVTDGVNIGKTYEYTGAEWQMPVQPVALMSGGARLVADKLTRPNNTTAYDAGDVLGSDPAANIEFINIAPVEGGHLVIDSVDLEINMTAIPSGMTTFTLHLYDAAPTAIADNTAFSQAADSANYLGYIAITAPKVVGACLRSRVNNIGFKTKTNGGGKSLWGILVTDAAWTPEASKYTKVTLNTRNV